MHTPFYDPRKSYEENFSEGPFGVFADGKVYEEKSEPRETFLGKSVHIPFGIPAGPLVNGKFVKAALDKGFDIAVYKTVRTEERASHPWPNVLRVDVEGDLTLEKAEMPLVADEKYEGPLSITNSFGVPSAAPEFWQRDLAEAVAYARPGQMVVGSFQATQGGAPEGYMQDFANAARLTKETGAPVLEANFSCPNEGSSALLCYDARRAKAAVEAIKREIGDTPLIIKIAYFEKDSVLRALVEGIGPLVQAIAAINTIPAEIRNKVGKQALPSEGRLRSGVCGHAIKWAGLEMTRRLHALRSELGMKYAIVGVGGVSSSEDYEEYRAAGADAVMAATGAMWNPYLAQEIKNKVA
ncbi:MAG: dihydroorotate oxidase [Candidatus Liptonbacteria bacterium]|nr:dihydroorotate oxidase [Candidatus Liptonbacteria bacterium]